MYLNDYYGDQQLGGIGKKLKKAVKKIAKPVLHIGAAVLTSGASLALSAKVLAAEKQRKAMAAQAAKQAEVDKAAIAAQERIAMAQAGQGMVAPAASPLAPQTSIAPPAGAVQQLLPSPTMTTFAPSGGGSYDQVLAPTSSAQPKWLIPAALGGGLLLVMMMNKRR